MEKLGTRLAALPEKTGDKIVIKIARMIAHEEEKLLGKAKKQAGKVAEKEAQRKAKLQLKIQIAGELKAREQEFKAQLRAERKARMDAFNATLKSGNVRKA